MITFNEHISIVCALGNRREFVLKCWRECLVSPIDQDGLNYWAEKMQDINDAEISYRKMTGHEKLSVVE